MSFHSAAQKDTENSTHRANKQQGSFNEMATERILLLTIRAHTKERGLGEHNVPGSY